ncbi:MAG: type I glyceraldehyde-3-phosphate dehydrogenase [Candidatus Omnitrophica bacterium]|nr:type I glyceraldehyde-3-phosphate dehydrogenase [Candidatus Omnitrophota bacterium]
MRIAINGFGRIGRIILRAAIERKLLGKKLDIVGINNPGGAQIAAQLLKYDSTYGILPNKLDYGQDYIQIDGYKIKILSDKEPLNLPWKKLDVDVVLECTGAFTDREGASKHLKAGAKKVIVSAPCKENGADLTIVMGVNDNLYDKKKHHIISNASCTTNSLAPVLKVLDENFKIKHGFMTTTHAYTNDQRILDGEHKDLRRARSAAINIIPTKTGAASAIGEVLPNLAGRLDGVALRVPVPCGSITDITVAVQKKASKEEVNQALKKSSEKELKGILQFSTEPLVSTDIIKNPHSAIVDGQLTKSIENMIKVFSWYDNEWGYSNRMLDVALKLI